MKEAQDRIRSSGRFRLLLPLALAVIGMALVTLAVAAEPAWNAPGGVSPRGTIPEPADRTISGLVYHDLDGDGEYDDGSEPGIGGVTVTLQPGGETWVTNEVTDASGPKGGYWFGGIEPGEEYTVTCSPVPGYVSTSPSQVTGVTLTNDGTVPGEGPAILHFGKALTSTVATLEVHLALQGRPARPNGSWSVPVTYTIGGVYTNSVATSDIWGRFEVANVVQGLRDVAIKNPHTLSTLITDVQIVAPTTVLTVTLYEGDANNDDMVGSADVAVLKDGYWQASGETFFEPGADFNEDDYADAKDASLLGANFFSSGPMPGAGPLAQTPALRFSASSTAIDVGDIVTVTVAIETGGTAVQAADLFVRYDPRFLQVVDETGAQTTAVIPVTDTLGIVLKNQVDLGDGVISYAALSTTDYTPGTYVNVMRIRFRAMRPTTAQGTLLEFLDNPGTRRITLLCVDGYDVLQNRYDEAITIDGTTMWFSYIARDD